jgi:hypothetical protein
VVWVTKWALVPFHGSHHSEGFVCDGNVVLVLVEVVLVSAGNGALA